MLKWLRRLLGKPKPAAFSYEVWGDGYWRCLACKNGAVYIPLVWEKQLGYHAQVAHGWRPGRSAIAPQTVYSRIPIDARNNAAQD